MFFHRERKPGTMLDIEGIDGLRKPISYDIVASEMRRYEQRKFNRVNKIAKRIMRSNEPHYDIRGDGLFGGLTTEEPETLLALSALLKKANIKAEIYTCPEDTIRHVFMGMVLRSKVIFHRVEIYEKQGVEVDAVSRIYEANAQLVANTDFRQIPVWMGGPTDYPVGGSW
jgi:hypothetical protein